MYEKVMIIGASRGLGRSVARFLEIHIPGAKSVFLAARKSDSLEETKKMMAGGPRVTCVAVDMASDPGRETLRNLVKSEGFDLVIYSAGGGPHGEYRSKAWKDHFWSLQVGLISPMNLVHEWLSSREPQAPGKFVIVGSRIAESSPDPLSSSYAAGKYGLLGFVGSLQEELSQTRNQVWLFSPGYMDSEMLPLTAKVRHDGTKLMSVDAAAQALLRWVKKENGHWHRVIN